MGCLGAVVNLLLIMCAHMIIRMYVRAHDHVATNE